jgi:hypothetical protein
LKSANKGFKFQEKFHSKAEFDRTYRFDGFRQAAGELPVRSKLGGVHEKSPPILSRSITPALKTAFAVRPAIPFRAAESVHAKVHPWFHRAGFWLFDRDANPPHRIGIACSKEDVIKKTS